MSQRIDPTSSTGAAVATILVATMVLFSDFFKHMAEKGQALAGGLWEFADNDPGTVTYIGKIDDWSPEVGGQIDDFLNEYPTAVLGVNNATYILLSQVPEPFVGEVEGNGILIRSCPDSLVFTSEYVVPETAETLPLDAPTTETTLDEGAISTLESEGGAVPGN